MDSCVHLAIQEVVGGPHSGIVTNILLAGNSVPLYIHYFLRKGLCIAGVLLGWMAGVSTLLLPLQPNHGALVALALGSLPTVTAVLFLLPYPLGATSEIAGVFDPNNQTGKLSFFLCGLIIVCMFSILKTVLSMDLQRARNGGIVGFLVAILVQSTLGALCAGTPYCLF